MAKGARSIWSGAISFGLVNIPVKLQSAVQDDNIDFDMLSKDDLAPIKYARIDSKTGEEVSYKDIVKGYQYAKGKYVIVTDEDFEKARPEIAKTIDIIQFVKEDEIDPIYYEKPYYIVPAKGSEKSYGTERISPKEIQLATKLINQLTETFNPAAHKDTYISELKKVIKAKAAGKSIHIAEPKRDTATVKDLMEVLKQSLESKKKRA
ncbi:MAG: Ku protein [Chitinophagaceae bacterium]|nr:MAG: Ku protein [Chitinophagaceae bacterium]